MRTIELTFGGQRYLVAPLRPWSLPAAPPPASPPAFGLVAISADSTNALEIRDDGLFVVLASGASPVPTGAAVLDGQRVLVMSDGGTVALWPVEEAPGPAASALIMTPDGFVLADPAPLPPLTIIMTGAGFIAAPAT